MDQAIDDRAESTRERAQSMPERVGPLLLIAATVFVIDQLTKAAIRGWLEVGTYWPADFELIRISHVENRGAAFGTLQGAGPLLVIPTAIAIVLIALTLLRSDSYPRSHLFALAMILGGAVGNLADRLVRGSVTDFIDPTHYPSFNIADSAIVLGVSAILLLTLFDRDKEQPEDSPPSEQTPQ
jgi:signal peptidase II